MSERGKIHNRVQAQQIRDFSGLRYGKITPTDIDAFFEFGDSVFIYIELKYGGASLPTGQRMALERQCDRVGKGGGNAYLLVASHKVPPDEDIVAHVQPVTAVYHEGKWSQVAEGWTLKRMIDWILEKHNSLGAASG